MGDFACSDSTLQALMSLPKVRCLPVDSTHSSQGGHASASIEADMLYLQVRGRPKLLVMSRLATQTICNDAKQLNLASP